MKTPIKLLTATVLAGALACSTAAAEIDPNTPDGFVKVQRKIQCSLVDEKPVVFTWSGRAWSRVPGERDRNVFNKLSQACIETQIWNSD